MAGGLTMESDDVVSVGTGAGGGTLAGQLAPARRRILLLERGDRLWREPSDRLAQDRVVNPAPTAPASSLRAGDRLLERLA
jgi:choline dehydrogenase-like flavoprotein